jgi:hypothetical protein
MEIREMINKMKNFGTTKVYTCVDGIYDKNKKTFDYFAVNLEYAKHFGDNCYMVTLNTSKFKVLEFGMWNIMYTEKTGLNGNKYNRNQGIFVVGEQNLLTNYEEPVTRFKEALGDEITNKFLDELNNCDAVYGEDAGYVDEFVFAVKNKDMVIKIEALS